MISTLVRTSQGERKSDLTTAEIVAAIEDVDGLLWVDLADEPEGNCRTLLHDTFGFHPLAVADALEEKHVPKVDDWGRYLYLVLHAVRFDSEGETSVGTWELDVFVGRNYLVTYHPQPIAAVTDVWEACQRDERHMQVGASHLLYKLTDELIADYMPVIDQIDDAIDGVEDRVFGAVGIALLEDIFTLKRGLLHLRRIIAPLRETLNKLARGDFAVIEADEKVFFRDVYDHLVRLYDITEGMRDLVGGALDTYLSVVNNRMNEVMKTLTVITTLFMPISFLVGFFGTNFFQPVASLSAWTDRPAFYLALSAMVVVPGVMFFWMRKRAWM